MVKELRQFWDSLPHKLAVMILLGAWVALVQLIVAVSFVGLVLWDVWRHEPRVFPTLRDCTTPASCAR